MTPTPSAATADKIAPHVDHVEGHLPLVRKVAKRIARRLPSVVDLDDLIGAGTLGLLDALQRFDPVRAERFEQYAEIRIRGAILDHLRAMDWLPRSARARSRRVSSAEQRLQARGQAPSAQNVAALLGEDERKISRVDVSGVVSVEDVRADGFEGFIVDGPGPSFGIENAEKKKRLASAIAQLPLRERQLLALYYVEELTLKQIGLIFGVTESRVCQLHSQAIARLRDELLDDVEIG